MNLVEMDGMGEPQAGPCRVGGICDETGCDYLSWLNALHEHQEMQGDFILLFPKYCHHTATEVTHERVSEMCL